MSGLINNNRTGDCEVKVKVEVEDCDPYYADHDRPNAEIKLEDVTHAAEPTIEGPFQSPVSNGLNFDDNEIAQMISSSDFNDYGGLYKPTEVDFESEPPESNILNIEQSLNSKSVPRERPFPCQHCDRRFLSISNLAAHVKIHTGTYQCQQCWKVISRSHLARHSRIHKGVKPHRCEECGKSFSQSGHLARHIGVHTGLKPYRCEICNKSFTDSSTLARHVKIHSGLKPYECLECGKAYTDSSTLARHIKTNHTKNEVFDQTVVVPNDGSTLAGDLQTMIENANTDAHEGNYVSDETEVYIDPSFIEVKVELHEP